VRTNLLLRQLRPVVTKSLRSAEQPDRAAIHFTCFFVHRPKPAFVFPLRDSAEFFPMKKPTKKPAKKTAAKKAPAKKKAAKKAAAK
jgi:hypothetical protein